MKRAPVLLAWLLFYFAACSNNAGEKDQLKNEHVKPSVPKKVLLVLTSNDRVGSSDIPTGYWLKEAALPWKIFTEAGIEVDFASPAGGRAPVDENSLNYMDSATEQVAIDTAFIAATDKTIPLKQVNASDYDGVLYVGGHGPLWDFPEDEDISRITVQLYENNKVVAAVCHGTAALVNIRLGSGNYLVDGHAVTGITNEEEKAFERLDLIPFFLESVLTERGAKFSGAKPWQANVVVSDNLVTGQNPASAEGVAKTALAMIKEKELTISEQRFWELMEDISSMGSFIVAVPSEGASANIIGKFKVEHNGRENVLQVTGNKDHVHIYPEHLDHIEFKYIDVGYGPEPCITFVNHRSAAFLKLYYMGGSSAGKQQQLLEANGDIKSIFKGKW